MTAESAVCPGCGAGMDPASVDGARRYLCGGCGSEMIGLAVLNRLLADGEARRLWTSARPSGGPSDGAAGAPPRSNGGSPNRCPFCSTSMCDAKSSHGRIGVCRRCEMLWLTKEAIDNLLGTAAQPNLTRATITRCENCGGPLKNSPDGRCRYCGYQVIAPQTVIVIDGHDPPPEHGRAGQVGWMVASLAESLLDILADP